MPGQDKKTTEAKKQRVIDALNTAIEDGAPVSIRGIARAAGVDHVFIMRREDLRAVILGHERLMDEEDIRRPAGTATLSDRERAFVDRARGKTPMGQYARRALLAQAERDLGESAEDLELDTARRPAQRRRNSSERQQQEKGQQS